MTDCLNHWMNHGSKIKKRCNLATMGIVALSLTCAAQAPPATPAVPAKETHITPQQAKDLFHSVDQIMEFASQDSGLKKKHEVKRHLTTRSEVEAYITKHFNEDKDTRRMERSEIVLKKFGLLDHDFHLQPFLVSLLREQIAGYYDNKTKTVNLLDWIEPEQQKPVLAHELTHALQDQHVDLEKWGDQSMEALSHDVDTDNKHIVTDEADTARDAVAEGQAMVVFVDWGLKPKGVTIRTVPNIMAENADDTDASAADSPVLARAPLVLQQQLLFPYKEGLNFEQVLLQDKGTEAAFANVLDRPPSSSYEIMNPRAYEKGTKVPLLHMPDVHPLLDAKYDAYDIGVMGELDVRMLAELFGGRPAGAAMATQWDGGLYYAAQSKQATPAQQSSTASVAIFYLSAWKTEDAASKFAGLYANSLNKKYSSVNADPDDALNAKEHVYNTEDGPVLIAQTGKQVFISETFDLLLARKLQLLMRSVQNNDAEQVNVLLQTPRHELTSPLSGWIARSGMMQAGIPH